MGLCQQCRLGQVRSNPSPPHLPPPPSPPPSSGTLPAVRALATSPLLLHSSWQTSHPLPRRQWDSSSNAGSGRFAQPPEELSQFFIHLALCNTVVPGTAEDGTLQYQVSRWVAYHGTLKWGGRGGVACDCCQTPSSRTERCSCALPHTPLTLSNKLYPAACCA